jgi:hypothetical protein
MKTVFSVLVLSMSAFAVHAFADESVRSSPRRLNAAITRVVHIDEHLSHIQRVNGGQITLDLTARQATLTLYQPYFCPVDAICIAMMPAPVKIDLPLISKRRDSCGIVVYTALRDARPVDGILEVLEISDNTRNTCPTFVQLAPTDVSYRTAFVSRMNGVEGKTHSQFEADKLSLLPVSLANDRE